ncbi:MAG: HYR domain-containing protein, partial [Pseudomonas sp.]|nr:HYR domain-containing protein [Pseudomonas sp.]
TPAQGAQCQFGENFVWTVQASDDNLYSLEIDHSMEGTLPEFTVYASETDPYGGDVAAFTSAGVSVSYSATTQKWTIDFGPAVTQQFINNGGITFYIVLKDCNGNEFGSMSPTTSANTFAYTFDNVAPILEAVTPLAGAQCLGGNFIWTVDASDANLYSLEVDHSMEGTLPEFTVYASETNPYGGDEAAFASAGVSVSYSATTQKWTIDFGATITQQFIGNGGITFYIVLKDCNGNEFGSMSPTAPANTFAYVLHPLPTATIASGQNQSVCFGGNATINVTLSGTSPWSITYSDGTNPTTITNITTSTYVLNVAPTANTTYTVINVTDANGCSNVGTGSARVYVGPITTISSIADACPGSTIEVPVTVTSFEEVGTVALAIKYDPSKLTYVSSTTNAGMMPNFGVFDDPLNSTLYVTGILQSTSETPVTLPDNSTLFTPTFTYHGGTATLEFYDPVTDPSQSEYGFGDWPIFTPFCDIPTTIYYINGTITPETTDPTISCPANVTVEVNASSNPSATGFATATDNCTLVPVITFSDVWTPGTCTGTGVIKRTWTATDAAFNSATCVQTIEINDTQTPAITCPADIALDNDPGQCCAVATFTAPVSYDPGYNESWDNTNYVAGDYIGWSPYNSNIISVPSGTNGINAVSGAGYGLAQSAGVSQTGIFSRLGSYNSNFGNGYRVRQSVYMDLSDPAVLANTYGWDLSAASSNQAGGHLRDFIFHTASNASGEILVAGSNNSNFARRNDLATLNHHTITASGWYTFEFVFRDDAGALAVDLNLLNAGGSVLWTETRTTPADQISTFVGGNRYLWFTFLAVDNLAIDNTSIERLTAVSPDLASGTQFPVGTTEVTYTSVDVCGNDKTCSFYVVVTDVEDPTITAPAAVSVFADAGICTASGVTLGTPTTGDNCSVVSVVNDAVEPFALGNTTVTWTVTDGSGNTATATQIVTVIDNQNPTITAPAAVSVFADAGICTASGVTLGTPTTGDNCSVISVVNDAVEPFALGNTTVTWTVTDGSGNTATATQIITVIDNQNPTITSPAAVSVFADAGICTASGVTLGTPITGDNCSVVSVVNDAVEPFALGNTTVTWTVTDGSGNTATATQIITVIDNQNPTITAPATVSVFADASICTASGVTLGTPTTGDNCSVVSVVNDAV